MTCKAGKTYESDKKTAVPSCQETRNPYDTYHKLIVTGAGIMANKTLFDGLVYDEWDNPVQTALVGSEASYVIDDDGFLRHIDAEEIDRQVLSLFLSQLEDNRDIAVAQMLNMMGKDDLFTKAAIDAQINNINMDQIIAQGIPSQARDMLGLLGFRIKINVHGEIIAIDQPAAPDDES